MSLPSSPPPEALPPPTLADLRLGDLLLTLVFGLGATRFAGVLAVALLAMLGVNVASGLPDVRLLLAVVLSLSLIHI